MSTRRHALSNALGCTLVGLMLSACSDGTEPISPEMAAADHAAHEAPSLVNLPAEYNKQLADLRRATAPFHNFDKAVEAGWSLQFTPCIMNPTQTAGMGYHYVNQDLADDATLNVNEPEALLYEPDASGKLRLVAVEYIVPFSVHPSTAAPPELFGLQFSRSPAFQVWGLHAWVWKHNSAGMHAGFNPDVSCG
ncbi:MAG TPA: hypothetical protein VK912_09885 [Longimicrobiales bacterium]|nr:hypothetical protein [Longimicrobiales bacterium]